MRLFLTALLMAITPAVAAAQGQYYQRPVPQAASCQTIAVTVSQRASQGFHVLNASKACNALQMLENAYSTLDTGRAQCGRGWAKQLAILEMDLLDALDYAGESCAME